MVLLLLVAALCYASFVGGLLLGWKATRVQGRLERIRFERREALLSIIVSHEIGAVQPLREIADAHGEALGVK